MTDLTVPAIAGAIAPFVLSLINRYNWSKQTKSTVSLVFYAAVTLGVWFADKNPATWQAFAQQLSAVIAAGQVAYTALRPSGILKNIEYATTKSKESDAS